MTQRLARAALLAATYALAACAQQPLPGLRAQAGDLTAAFNFAQ
ncbi:MAG TPA: hypothetical protein VKG21_10225 [Casimicrobiaceae bacterium]|nr:hypothetical protein [Casimicrobiaceae bacterium]